MASISSIQSIRNKLDHKINTYIVNSHEPNTYTRTVSSGKSISGSFKIDSYSTHPISEKGIPVQKVNSFEEYIAGCSEHDRCIGLFCETPNGNILLPQRFASMVGVMSNDFAKAAEALFKNDSYSQGLVYRETIRQVMMGKRGKMRGDIMGGVTDGSGREVISSSWVEPNEFCIPSMVAKNMRVLKIGKDSTTNLPLNHYIEDSIKEGDYIIVIRPPSLWLGNVQPMKVVLWEHECFGPSASNLSEYHGDNDGDEMQIYAIAQEDAIKECENWKQLNPCKFLEAVMNYKLPYSITKFVLTNRYKHGKKVKQEYYGDDAYKQLRKVFMVTSTLSVRELMDGIPLPQTSKAARMKEPMANMFVNRLKNPKSVVNQFTDESIRGIKDVMAQQLHQGHIGDMSRQARLAASCIKYKGHGIFHIMTANEVIKQTCIPLQTISNDIAYPLGGNSCMRAISSICAVAQQAALDSHRVSQEISSSLNLIENLITGGDYSLIFINSGTLPTNIWKYETSSGIYSIVYNKAAMSYANRIKAAYSPTILRAIKAIKGDVTEVCKNGISIICNYYNIKLTELELYSVVQLFCYNCEQSEKPITTKEGIEKRNMRWMVSLFANHYGKFKDIEIRGKTKRMIRPQTITEAVAVGNFDYL